MSRPRRNGSWTTGKRHAVLAAVMALLAAATTTDVYAVRWSNSEPSTLWLTPPNLYWFLHAPRANTLTWRPPVCGDATHACATLNLSNTGNHQDLRLDSTRDWIVKLPSVPLVGGIDIDGGHNVIIIGGEIDLPTPCQTDNGRCHGINIDTWNSNVPSTGEIYIEGVLIKNPDPTHSKYTGDGIDVNTPAVGNLTLQNVRIEGIDGCDANGNSAHADVLQPYQATNIVLQIDHLTGTTDYQGMQISPDLSSPRRGDFRNVNIDVFANSHAGCAGNDARYGWWLTGTGCQTYPMNLSNDYLSEPNGSLQSNAVWPDTDASFGCPATYSGGFASWPAIRMFTAGIHNGLPPGGDFVRAGRVGIGYVTPGYR